MEDFNDPQTWLKPIIDQEIGTIIKAARTVYDELGTGHTEAVYEAALEVELFGDFSTIRRQVPCPIVYKGWNVGTGFIDLMIGDIYVVEIKTVSKLTNKDEAQVRKYLQKGQHGLLINFNPSTGTLEVVKVSE